MLYRIALEMENIAQYNKLRFAVVPGNIYFPGVCRFCGASTVTILI